MKDLWKYIFSGMAVALLCVYCVMCLLALVRSVSWEVSATIGIGAFLSFEMVVLAGIVIKKINKQ